MARVVGYITISDVFDGATGPPGDGGSSQVVAYGVATGVVSPTGASIVTAANGYPAINAWGVTWAVAWGGVALAIGSGQTIYISYGLYNPVTSQITWGLPYLSSFRVGQLSAISANLGTITGGSISLGTNPGVSGGVMTGVGALINTASNGNFAVGNSTNSLIFDGATLKLNGNFIVGGNIVAKTIDATKVVIDGTTIIAGPNGNLQVGMIGSGQVTPGANTVIYSSNSNGTARVIANSETITNFATWSSYPISTYLFAFTTIICPSSFVVAGFSGLAAATPLYLFFKWNNFNSDFIAITANGTYTKTFIGGGSSSSIVPTPSLGFQYTYSTGTLGTVTVTMLANVNVTFSDITNPSPATKTIVELPSFNTYP